jgi:hypothetical protein
MSRQSKDFRELLKYKKESQSDGKNLEEFKQGLFKDFYLLIIMIVLWVLRLALSRMYV